MALSLHDNPEFFREAVLYTAGRTGLSAALVEKDYFGTVLLAYFYQHEDSPLVFKGGTSLSKIYADFHRLSEDLDFAIPTPSGAPRSVRRRRIAPVKEQVAMLEKAIPAFTLAEGLVGHDDSTQYIAQVTYVSAVEAGAVPARIKIEVGLREELVRGPVPCAARTLLENPFTRRPAVPELHLTALDKQEAYAEKMRAALTRREPAIRDFYDIDHAVTHLHLEVNDQRFIDLVLKKLGAPGNNPIDISLDRREALQRQVETQLRPVLRSRDYGSFQLDRAFAMVAELGARVRAANGNGRRS